MSVYTLIVQTRLPAVELAALRDVVSHCLCFKARKAARAVTRFYDRYFAGTKLEPAQFNLLVAIRLTEPLAIAELAALLGLDRTTFTRNLGLLRRDGLVNVRPGEDARQRLVSITAAGIHALQQALPRWAQAQAAARATLGRDHFEQLSASLSLATVFAEPGGKRREHRYRNKERGSKT